MLWKISTRWQAAIAILFLLALLAGPGVAGYTAVQEGNGTVDELINMQVMEQQKVEKGQKTFEELLRQKVGKVPKYGTEDYWQRLTEYADPAGKLRRQDPQKWELIDAYAYDYYVRNILPPVGSPEEELRKQSQQKPAPTVIQSGSYNRSGAVNYAYRYVGNASDNPFYKNYNPAYHAFRADCTNFVSQCLKEGGGIPMVDAWWRPWWDKDDWYYYRHGSDAYDSNNDDDWSWSWVKVETLHWHIRSRLGTLVSSPSQLQLGDIVQLNLDDSDPNNDHSMIVTKIDSAGNRYVTYHTTNTKDRKLSDISGTKYYLHITY